MELNNVVLGQTFTASADFYNNKGTPFVPQSSATYLVKDFNGNLVTSGFGAQDGQYPQRWTANITIPQNAPFDSNKKYLLVWTLLGDNNSVCNQTELFNVQSNAAVFDNKYSESVVVFGNKVNDSLVLPNNQTASNISLRLIDENDTVYSTTSSTVLANLDGNSAYFAEFDQTDLPLSFRPYVVEWTFTLNGRVCREYHFVYIVSSKIIVLMDSLRQFINKVRFEHPNPNLRFTEADMIYYLIQGMGIINGTRPQVSSWTLKTFPPDLNWYLINAAAYVALSAQYLAEGVSAFEFSGQSVSLTIDRAQFIDSALGRITDVIDNKWPVVKTNMVKAGSAGVLLTTWSPSFNSNFAFSNGLTDGYPGEFYARVNFYDGIVQNLGNTLLSGA